MNDDALYSDDFKDIIKSFCKITSNNIFIKDISTYIVAFCRSRILNLLLCDPQHDGAKECVTSYLAENPTLPHIFLSRFLAVANAKIQITSVRFGSSMTNSCVVTVIPASTRPPTKITNLTAASMRERLREDTKAAKINQASPQNMATRVKINFTPRLMDQLINSMIGLHKVIDEGNRQNGHQIDSYVKFSKNT